MSYIWRNLLQRRVRTFLSVLGVAVSIAGVVALIAVSDGMRASVDTHMTKTGASLTVFNREAADLMFSRVSVSTIEQIEKMDGVMEVCRGNAVLLSRPDLGGDRKKPPLQILFGRIPGERLATRLKPFLIDGRLPTKSDESRVGSIVAARPRLVVNDFP